MTPEELQSEIGRLTTKNGMLEKQLVDANNTNQRLTAENERLTAEAVWLHGIILEHVGTDAANVDPKGYAELRGESAT